MVDFYDLKLKKLEMGIKLIPFVESLLRITTVLLSKLDETRLRESKLSFEELAGISGDLQKYRYADKHHCEG